jgi:hypothetical protein
MANPTEAALIATSSNRWRFRAEVMALALLPVVLALAAYYRPVARGGLSELPVSIDGGFYTYQLARAGEVGGRWWQMADSAAASETYRSSAAKHPGLYEGLDLLLISAVTTQFLDPVANYHLMVLIVLAFNGWVAAWIVRRQTGSFFWAALATLLITVNTSTALNMTVGHLHLFKYGWVLLAALAYFRYLDNPTLRRGLWLGVAAALVLQGSFYFGYFLTLALGICWLLALVCGKLGRDHLLAAGAAATAYALTGAAVTFPVWTIARRDPLAGAYFERDPREIWLYGSELFQYLVPPFSRWAPELIPWKPHIWETWHYPGLAVVLAVAGYLVARWRRWEIPGSDPRLVARLIGLVAVLIFLSLAAGPGNLLLPLVSSFRCYGRAGLLAVGLLCVAAPMIWCGLLHNWSARPRYRIVLCALLTMAICDAARAGALFQCYRPATPAWVTWLAGQPAEVRLAAFAPTYAVGEGEPGQSANLSYRLARNDWSESWNWFGLYYRTLHHHDTLNGCEFALLQADLQTVSATYSQMNRAGLQRLGEQGYRIMAFHAKYLEANGWITTCPDLTLIDEVDDWRIYRLNMERDATASTQ